MQILCHISRRPDGDPDDHFDYHGILVPCVSLIKTGSKFHSVTITLNLYLENPNTGIYILKLFS